MDLPQSPPSPAPSRSDTLTPKRVEALSDGVMAIAATILVLNIVAGVPRTGQTSVWEAITAEGYAYLGYFISFMVIGLIWMSHHSMFDRLRTVDRPIALSNLVLLSLVAFIPWPTGLLAEFFGAGGNDAAVATAFYSFVMTTIGLVFTFQWAHLRRHPELLRPGIGLAGLHRAVRLSLVGPAVYAATIPLAFVSPIACIVVYAALSAFFATGPSARALMTSTHRTADRKQ